MRTRGFSLIELSIVLVILGLLVGGILAAQSLTRAAEIRSVGTESQRYLTAINAFRDKFFAVPGDFARATSIWGDDNTNCPDAAITNGTPGTCNGNGDGNVEISSAAGATGEMFQFWKQLALAGLIEGSYSGLAGSSTANQVVGGSNSPISKGGGAAWTALTRGASGDANLFTLNYGHTIQVGAQTATGTSWEAFLRPEDAWNLDTKYDDGKPGIGKVIATKWSVCTTAALTTDTATALYKLDSPLISCGLIFSRAF